MPLTKKWQKMQLSDRYTLLEIAEYLGASLVGDTAHQISGLATLELATSDQLSFFANSKYNKFLQTTQAGCVLIQAGFADSFVGNTIICDDPYLAYAKVSALFAAKEIKPQGQNIHPSAVIADDASIPENITIAANVVIERGCVLGDFTRIGAGSCIAPDVVIGEHCLIHANVSVYEATQMGAHCIIHSGAVIGADGFGFAPSPKGWQKIHQLGRVILGNHVEIGASTTIDRGALADTVIGDGVKIDNQVQIAHNVQIGKNTAIAASTAIAGSTVIGESCTIAGCVGIVGHITIASHVHISGMTMVSKSIKKPGSYSSGLPMSETKLWRKNAARFGQLDQIARQVKAQEKNQSS